MLIDTIESAFDIPIHHYVNVDFAGFQGLVEAVGSVDVYFETPARDWNVNAKPLPRSQTGFIVSEAGCHALDPPTALAYVRSRYYQTQTPDGAWVTDPRSDFGRISRQQDFLRRLMQRAIDLGARNPFVLKDLIDAGLANVAIDDQLTPQLLVDVGTTYRSFDPSRLQTYSVPAVDAVVDGNQVLQPQWAELEPLLRLMRGASFDDPTTVRISLIGEIGADEDTLNVQEVVAESMYGAGYELERHALSRIGTGLAVHHGPDGQAAAELVVNELSALLGDEPAVDVDVTGIAVVQVDHLKGRTVQVRVGPPPNNDASNTAQANTANTSDSDKTGAESPVSTPEGNSDHSNEAERTSTLDGSEAGGRVSEGDALDSTEADCRTS